MALEKCKECEKEISDSARICPYCGYKRKRKKTWLWILLALLSAFMAFGIYENNQPYADARSAVRACWEMARTNLGLINGCKDMERRFIAKWGFQP